MKNALIALVVVLQLATLALLAGQLLRAREEKEAAPDLQATLNNVSAALNQVRTINIQLSQQLKNAPPRPTSATAADPREIGPQPRDPAEIRAETPFPDALKEMQDLAKLLANRRDAVDRDESNIGPFDQRIEECRRRLLGLGADALYWAGREAQRQPYDEKRDVELIEFCVRELLPELSAADRENNKATAFAIARDAMLTVTNENSVRAAGAVALRQIDPDLWQKEYVDLIGHGGKRERDVTLRIILFDAFIERPWPDVVQLCRYFIGEARTPIALRTHSILVLERQESSVVVPTLRDVLFEDHTPEMRLHALDALHRLLGTSDQMRDILEDVLGQDVATMHGIVREKAQLLLEGMTAPSEAS